QSESAQFRLIRWRGAASPRDRQRRRNVAAVIAACSLLMVISATGFHNLAIGVAWDRTLLPLVMSAGSPIGGVAHVVDGDTIVVAGTTLRLAGIDAPELGQTCQGAERSFDCGRLVAGALRTYIAGRNLQCAASGTDRYGRTLARCFV